MFTTMGGMGQDFHNRVKYMEYYAAKIPQVEKIVEVSNSFPIAVVLRDKDYMLLFKSIRLLRFYTGNCVIIFLCILLFCLNDFLF